MVLRRARVTVLRLAVLASLLLSLASPLGAPLSARAAAVNGPGMQVVVDANPFRLSFVNPSNGARLSEVASDGNSVCASVQAASPELNPLGCGGFSPLEYVVGTSTFAQFVAGEWDGNPIAQASVGSLFYATSAGPGVQQPDGSTLYAVSTSQPDPAHPGQFLAGQLRIAFSQPGRADVSFNPPAQPPGLTIIASGDAFASPADERFFGFGERFDAVNQRGRVRSSFIEEENFNPSSASNGVPDNVPFAGPNFKFPNGRDASYYEASTFLSSHLYSVLLDRSEPALFDMAATRGDAYKMFALANTIQYSVQFGSTMTDVVTRSTAVTGREPIPQPWVFEPWMTTIGAVSEGDPAQMDAGTGSLPASQNMVRQRLLDNLATIQKDGVPIKVMGVEGAYAIPDMAQLAQQMHSQGYHVVLYMNPFVGVRSADFTVASNGHFLVTNAANQPYVFFTPYNGPAALPDFTQAAMQNAQGTAFRAWWRGQLERMLNAGADGWMLDFGEEVLNNVAPLGDMHFANGMTGLQLHNAYPTLYDQATRAAVDGWAQAHGAPSPMFYVRAGYNATSNVGGQSSVASTGVVFPGDETVDWGAGTGIKTEIPGMVNLSVLGIGEYTMDIAGYADIGETSDAELFTRWSQMGALSPVMRVHNGPIEGEKLPWSFDPTTLARFNSYALLHHNLGAYLNGFADVTHSTGLGIARPLYVNDLGAPDGALDTEYLLGTDLLIAPILDPGLTQRNVYLPAGDSWLQLTVTADGKLARLGQFQRGGTTVAAPAPIDQIPIFIRAGATGNPLLPLVRPSAPLPNTSAPAGLSALAGIALLGSLAIMGLGLRMGRRARRRAKPARSRLFP